MTIKPLDIAKAFPGARIVTTMPTPAPSEIPDVALVGKFDRSFKRKLERMDYWPAFTVVKRGEPIPAHVSHVVATDSASLNLLVGGGIGLEDLELWAIEGDLLTDGDHLVFPASFNLGAYMWDRWWRFITEGHVGATTMLPISCHKCEVAHRPKYLWVRDARGVGWCQEHWDERGALTRDAATPGHTLAGKDDMGTPNQSPDALRNDPERAKEAARLRKVAKARKAIREKNQQAMETGT